ncbi:MAG: hypothetical protein ACXAC2_12530 [Candidatus Kariarchaeaceae archaeon]|jgi:hypothetical protein
MSKGNLFSGLDHKEVINSLKDKLAIRDPVKLANVGEKIPTKFLSGNGSLDDNLKIINQYVCSCGAKTETFMHSFHSDNEGKALDSYHLNCTKCGQEERVSFHMLREALKKTRDVPIFIKRSKLHPYI